MGEHFMYMSLAVSCVILMAAVVVFLDYRALRKSRRKGQ